MSKAARVSGKSSQFFAAGVLLHLELSWTGKVMPPSPSVAVKAMPRKTIGALVKSCVALCSPCICKKSFLRVWLWRGRGSVPKVMAAEHKAGPSGRLQSLHPALELEPSLPPPPPMVSIFAGVEYRQSPRWLRFSRCLVESDSYEERDIRSNPCPTLLALKR